MFSKTFAICATSILFATCTSSVAGQFFAINWFTIDSGGGYSFGDGFELEGTIGQADAGPTLVGGSSQLNGGFWAEEQLGNVAVSSVNVILGNYLNGQVSDLDDSDDVRLCYSSGAPFSPTFPSIWVEFHGTLPTETPTTLEVVLESHVNDFGITQEVEMYNFVSGQFESVDQRTATRNVDSSVQVDLPGDVTRFVEPVTGNVRTKVTYTEDGTGFLLQWQACFDQMIWRYN